MGHILVTVSSTTLVQNISWCKTVAKLLRTWVVNGAGCLNFIIRSSEKFFFQSTFLCLHTPKTLLEDCVLWCLNGKVASCSCRGVAKLNEHGLPPDIRSYSFFVHPSISQHMWALRWNVQLPEGPCRAHWKGTWCDAVMLIVAGISKKLATNAKELWNEWHMRVHHCFKAHPYAFTSFVELMPWEKKKRKKEKPKPYWKWNCSLKAAAQWQVLLWTTMGALKWSEFLHFR